MRKLIIERSVESEYSTFHKQLFDEQNNNNNNNNNNNSSIHSSFVLLNDLPESSLVNHAAHMKTIWSGSSTSSNFRIMNTSRNSRIHIPKKETIISQYQEDENNLNILSDAELNELFSSLAVFVSSANVNLNNSELNSLSPSSSPSFSSMHIDNRNESTTFSFSASSPSSALPESERVSRVLSSHVSVSHGKLAKFKCTGHSNSDSNSKSNNSCFTVYFGEVETGRRWDCSATSGFKESVGGDEVRVVHIANYPIIKTYWKLAAGVAGIVSLVGVGVASFFL